MKKKHKIVMLPTEDKTGVKLTSGKYDSLKYLYILSDDEIKEGDWFMSAFYSYPIHNTKKWREKQESMVKGSSDCSDLKYHKIIATTDPKLHAGMQRVMRGNEVQNKIPQIPKSLIEYYVRHQPEEVELEYEEIGPGFPADIWFPKLQNNEVVWVEPEPYIQKCGRIERYESRKNNITMKNLKKLPDNITEKDIINMVELAYLRGKLSNKARISSDDIKNAASKVYNKYISKLNENNMNYNGQLIYGDLYDFLDEV